MYNAEQTKKLQTETGQWMAMKDAIAVGADIEGLRRILRFHEYRYYILNDPLIGDSEYDQMYKLLEKHEQEYPETITKDSPTQRVGSTLIKDFLKVQHLVPMLSLENSYNTNDLYDWDRKAREMSGLTEIEYCVEPKFDGASISVLYENDHLIRAITRGDGETGDDITPNARQIHSLPLNAAFSKYGIQQIEIRGEVLMNKKNFNSYNEGIIQEGLPPLANPRNAAAGSLRIKDPKIVAKRKLEAFLYHVSYLSDSSTKAETPQPGSHSGMLEMLWTLGFRSPKNEMKLLKGIAAVEAFITAFEQKRDALDYEIDGMVIKVNDLELQEKLGMTAHHPRWAIAFKFKARQASSKLLSVEFQVGRTGAVTPVAKIQPVQVSGVTVSSISVHNEEYILQKDLKIGDAILIERSGDVIPQIVKSLPELRSGTEQDVLFPKNCPVCHDKLFKPEGEAVWRCININCAAQVVERIIHFVSKDAMDIRSLGDSNVRKFYAMGIMKDIPSIYHISESALQNLEGFGSKSIQNLLQAIEASKTQPLHRIIYGLGIRYVGETTAKTLAQSVNNLMELADLNEEQLKQIDDVGTKVASSILEFFNNADNLAMLKGLEAAGVQLEKQQATGTNNADNRFEGLNFLFTGTLNQLKRSEAEEMVEQRGGKILSGVSSKLQFLIVGDDAGSKLEKAKKIPAIKIMTEDEFLQMVAS